MPWTSVELPELLQQQASRPSVQFHVGPAGTFKGPSGRSRAQDAPSQPAAATGYATPINAQTLQGTNYGPSSSSPGGGGRRGRTCRNARGA